MKNDIFVSAVSMCLDILGGVEEHQVQLETDNLNDNLCAPANS